MYKAILVEDTTRFFFVAEKSKDLKELKSAWQMDAANEAMQLYGSGMVLKAVVTIEKRDD